VNWDSCESAAHEGDDEFEGGVGGGEAADFDVDEAGGFGGGHDVGLSDLRLALGINHPESAGGTERGAKFLDLREGGLGFGGEEDEVGVFYGFATGDGGSAAAEPLEKTFVEEPEERNGGGGFDAEFVEEAGGMKDLVGPLWSGGAEVEGGGAVREGNAEGADGGADGLHRTEGDLQAEGAAEEKEVGFEEEFAGRGLAFEAGGAERFETHGGRNDCARFSRE